MGLSKYQKDLLAGKPWKWASGATRKRSFGDVNISDDVPISQRHGRRHIGVHDISDVPKDFDCKKAMPLPWKCQCGNILLHRPYNCGRCGRLTPLGSYSRDYENWWRS